MVIKQAMFDAINSLSGLPCNLSHSYPIQHGTHFLCAMRIALSQVVGHDKVRAVRRHLNLEQVHFLAFWNGVDFHEFAQRSHTDGSLGSYPRDDSI